MGMLRSYIPSLHRRSRAKSLFLELRKFYIEMEPASFFQIPPSAATIRLSSLAYCFAMARPQRAVKSLNEYCVFIHVFTIENDLNLYTLSTLACLPRRIAMQFTGEDFLSFRESLAIYRFWVEVGEMMGIQDIPSSPDAMLQWMIDYEASEYQPTLDGR